MLTCTGADKGELCSKSDYCSLGRALISCHVVGPCCRSRAMLSEPWKNLLAGLDWQSHTLQRCAVTAPPGTSTSRSSRTPSKAQALEPSLQPFHRARAIAHALANGVHSDVNVGRLHLGATASLSCTLRHARHCHCLTAHTTNRHTAELCAQPTRRLAQSGDPMQS